VLVALMNYDTRRSIDDTAGVQCVDDTGLQRGVESVAETSLVPFVSQLLRPTLLFTAPTTGLYHCRLWASTSSDASAELTALAGGVTYLSVTNTDEVGAHWWQNPDCSSDGSSGACTYLSASSPNTLVLGTDGTRPYTWAAASNANSIDIIANVEATTCYDGTLSCNGIGGDSDHSTVASWLKVVQLDPNGKACNATVSPTHTDVISNIAHHYNIPYLLTGVPVLATCGTRNFAVQIDMWWQDGNPVKIDGSRYDPVLPAAYTYAFASNTGLAPTTTVPKVTGLDQTSAQNALNAAGLATGTLSNVYNVAPPGTVVAQTASAGTVEPVGSPVNLHVSRGPGTATFTGNATATKPTTALSNARSRAYSKATGAGYATSQCSQVSESVDLNEFGQYDATVTLSCSMV
jgi:hypothetical protein